MKLLSTRVNTQNEFSTFALCTFSYNDYFDMARMTKKMQHGLNNNYLKLMGTRVNICKQFCIPASCTSAESFQQHVTTELRPQQVKKGIKRKNVMDS